MKVILKHPTHRKIRIEKIDDEYELNVPLDMTIHNYYNGDRDKRGVVVVINGVELQFEDGKICITDRRKNPHREILNEIEE